MSIRLSMSDEELYSELQHLGYRIEITTSLSHITKSVTFTGKYTNSHQVRYTYTVEWTNAEIIKDQLPRLLKWTGLVPVIKLE